MKAKIKAKFYKQVEFKAVLIETKQINEAVVCARLNFLINITPKQPKVTK